MRPSIFIYRTFQQLINAKALERVLPDYDTCSYSDIPYLPDGKEVHLLDVFTPKNAAGKLPLVLEVHGGGYVSCCKEINRRHGQYYASKGFGVVNVNYSLLPEATFAQEVQELAAALEWAVQNADRYGFDTNNIFLSGDSSGGHLVLLLAAAQNRPDLQELLGIKPIGEGFRGVAATCPVGTFDEPHLLAKALTLYLGPKFSRENNLHALSYDSFINDTFPPSYIVTAVTDFGIHDITRRIHEKLVRVNAKDHTYKVYHKQENMLPHVFNVLNPDWPEGIEANDDIIAFFRAHLV